MCWLGVLWPVLWAQARHVRRVALLMPEPPGQRAGTAGRGPLLRLLVAGDSGAAAVGVTSQADGLCGQLVCALSLHHTVRWCVHAGNGLDSLGLLKLVQEIPCERFDVVVLSIGANDATALHTPGRWTELQNRIADLIAERFQPALLMHSAVPPMHACQALPQPLRWFMGVWAHQMNQALASHLRPMGPRTLHWHPELMITTGMAADKIHPNAAGYAAWAHELVPHILGLASSGEQIDAST